MNGSRIAVAAALALALVTSPPEIGGAGHLPPNRISAVRIERSQVDTTVRISASRKPVFSIYTLEEPMRLVIDVAQGDVDKIETPIDVDDGVINKVVTAQYGSGKRAVGRVIIGFVRRVPYDVKASQNELLVRIAAVGKARPTAAAMARREAELKARAVELKEREQQLTAARKMERDARAAQKRAEEALSALRSQVSGLSAKSKSEADQALKEKEAELNAKDAELNNAREKLAASARQVTLARSAVSEAKHSLEQERAARIAEAKQRRKLESLLASQSASLVRERARVTQATTVLAALKKQLSGKHDLAKALAQTRTRAKEATRELQKLRRRARNLAAKERRARKAAESAGRRLAKARRDANDARRKAALEIAQRERVAQERLADKLKASERALHLRMDEVRARARDLANLRQLLNESRSSAASAKQVLSKKESELTTLRSRLAAAERVAKATAKELQSLRTQSKAQEARWAERLSKQEAQAKKRLTQATKRLTQATERLSQARKEASARKRVAAATSKREAPPPIVVRNVDFKKVRGRSRVVLTLEGEPRYVVQRKGNRKLIMDLPGAHLPSHLRRRLDVSAFGGPVSMVSAYESVNPIHAARVMVELREPAHYKVTRHGRDLHLDLSSGGGERLKVTKVRPALVAGPAAPAADDYEVLEAGKPVAQKRPRRKRRRRYRGRRINLDLQDADIHTVLKLISEVIRLNFVVSDDVKGRVSMTLRDVPWDQALTIILKSKGIGYIRDGNIIRVALEKVLRKEAEDEAKQRVRIRQAEPLLLKIIPVNYAKANELMPRVKDVLSEKGAVSVDKRTNRLIVRDVRQRIRAAERMVRKLDTQTPQILIEARIVEANTTFSREIGIQWGGNITMSPATGNPTGLVFPSTIGVAGGSPLGLGSAQGILNPTTPNFAVNLPATVGQGQGGAVGFTFGSIGGTVNLNLRLSAAEENGQAKIISAPKITTLDNKKATIQQGVSIPISQSSALGVNTIFVDANLVLTVTPHVTLDGSVIMDIIATKNEPNFVRVGAQGDPTIERKEARTQVLIKDGETTVIGGIYTRNTTTNVRSVPLLSRIPILGWLFKRKLDTDNRTELLIFITPRIVNRPAAIGS